MRVLDGDPLKGKEQVGIVVHGDEVGKANYHTCSNALKGLVGCSLNVC